MGAYLSMAQSAMSMLNTARQSNQLQQGIAMNDGHMRADFLNGRSLLASDISDAGLEGTTKNKQQRYKES